MQKILKKNRDIKKNNNIIFVMFCLGCALVFCSCGSASYTMETPDSFKKFENSQEFKMITANGVMLQARQVENYPKAKLKFWADALEKHLVSKGYVKKSSICFKTKKSLDGCTLDFMLPYGVEDWVLSETIFVVDDIIVLVEATGSFERYITVEEELKNALKTFDPNL